MPGRMALPFQVRSIVWLQLAMLQEGFDITITDQAVSVRNDSSMDEGSGWIGGILLIGFAVVMFVVMTFLPGRNDSPSVFDGVQAYLGSSQADSAPLMEAAFQVCLWGFVFLWGVRSFFPSGEALRVDKETFVVSKIPLVNLGGSWKTQTFPVQAISNCRYAVTFSARTKLWGFRYQAAGKNKKIFQGLKAPEAEKILLALQRLGVGVVDDPELPGLVQKALQERREWTGQAG